MSKLFFLYLLSGLLLISCAPAPTQTLPNASVTIAPPLSFTVQSTPTVTKPIPPEAPTATATLTAEQQGINAFNQKIIKLSGYPQLFEKPITDAKGIDTLVEQGAIKIIKDAKGIPQMVMIIQGKFAIQENIVSYFTQAVEELNRWDPELIKFAGENMKIDAVMYDPSFWASASHQGFASSWSSLSGYGGSRILINNKFIMNPAYFEDRLDLKAALLLFHEIANIKHTREGKIKVADVLEAT